MAKFSLSWDSYKDNICSGLTGLQQNGEFVDMTIAADGHHVKVHQMIMSLASPYIKAIIKSLECPHPVIFLTKVSYPILCAILEYIYTGEVLVEKENLTELVEAAKELHIMGLQDMKLELSSPEVLSQAIVAKSNQGHPLPTTINSGQVTEGEIKILPSSTGPANIDFNMNESDTDNDFQDFTMSGTINSDTDNDKANTKNPVKKSEASISKTPIQYTVSNMGSIQMVLNRCIFALRYTSVKCQGHRRWQCIDYFKKKCPATIITQDDVITKRYSAHNHPFHDRRILKKVRDNKIFSAIHEAESMVQNVKSTASTATRRKTNNT